MDPALLVPVLAATAVVAVLALLAALSRKRNTEDASRAYLAGVRYVLSDEPDAAIAELSRAAQLNTGTTETYFALAALMRRKGELAWAIRLGQNMLLKPQLQPEVRRRARLELALDYRRAGMQDRARETFEALVGRRRRSRPRRCSAFRRMLEETRDWPRAVEVQELLVKEEGSGDDVLAHLLAEQSFAVAATDPARARALAERATPLVPDGGHGLLALARARLASGDAAGARPAAQDAVAREPETAAQGFALLLEAGAERRGVRAVAGRAGGAARRARAPGVARPGRGADPGRPPAGGGGGAAGGRGPDAPLGGGPARPRASCCCRPASSTRCGTSTARCCAGWASRCWPSAAAAAARDFRTFDFRCPGCGAWDALARERGTTTGEFDPLRSRA